MNSYRSSIPLLIFSIIIRHIMCEASSVFNCSARDTAQNYVFDYAPLSETDISVVVNEQSQEKITLRLCSPISQNCATRSGYGVCSTKDGKEKGIGRFPPELKNAPGTQRFIFTGDLCEADKNYTVIVIMKCDYSAGGPSKPILFPKGRDACITRMIWRTDKACIPPTKTNCSVVDSSNNTYDLSPLTAMQDNHIAHIDYNNGSTSKLIINVCHSIIYEHGATCYGKPGACLEDSSNSSNIQYYNYGELTHPLFIDNGILKIIYENGIMCGSSRSNLPTYRTTISFTCDPEATVNTEPEFMNESEDCESKLLWKTALACNQTYLHQYHEINNSNCTVINTETQSRYDLRKLMGKDYVTNGTDGTQYKFRICGSLPDTGCTPGTGICKTNDSTSAGTANSSLKWRHGSIYLNYTDGATCGNDQKRYTLIAFVCAAEGSLDSPIVVKDEPCYLIIYWYTKSACGNETACATVKNETNLLPLIRVAENYIVKTTDAEFHINVCRPVVPTTNLACLHGSSACAVLKSSKDQYTKEISLGFPDQNPIWLDHDNVILNYTQGSPCPEYPAKNISSSLQFLCDYNGDKGIPVYKNYSNCHYVFEWKTNVVCSSVVGSMVSPCTIKDPSHSHEVNLSLLYQKPQPRLVTNKEKNYSVSICGGEKHCNGSAVCQGINGYGTFSSVTFDYRNSVIRLQYLHGSKCSEKSYASELSLICNSTTGIGEPRLVLDANCSALFEWHTNVTCLSDIISVPSITIAEKTLTDSSKTSTAAQTWVICGMLFLITMVIGIWFYLRNPRRCAHLRSRISAITAARNHGRVQYSRVNTTEEARLLLDTTDTSVDEQIDSDEELLGV